MRQRRRKGDRERGLKNKTVCDFEEKNPFLQRFLLHTNWVDEKAVLGPSFDMKREELERG